MLSDFQLVRYIFHNKYYFNYTEKNNKREGGKRQNYKERKKQQRKAKK